MHIQPTQKVYYCEYVNKKTNACQWLLTTDVECARETDQSFCLATLDDLYDWAAATGKVFTDSIITVFEGNVKWFEKEYVNNLGDTDYEGDYEFI